jgi:hypothetical protein
MSFEEVDIPTSTVSRNTVGAAGDLICGVWSEPN